MSKIQKEHSPKITCVYHVTNLGGASQGGKLKPLNPDRLIVLSRLLNTDKRSQRHPFHSSAQDGFSLCEGIRGGGKSGLRGKTDEDRRAEKLNAKLLGLWEGISPWSLRTRK